MMLITRVMSYETQGKNRFEFLPVVSMILACTRFVVFFALKNQTALNGCHLQSFKHATSHPAVNHFTGCQIKC
jgi:hypothetical protein